MPILNWLGRDEALKTAAKTPYRLLEEVPELGYGDKTKENMIIQGDNLEALKALLPFYAGQVKCIYIDPPYNTGSAFEHYDDNLEHSTWLSMMSPRLELLKEFLREDGSIWITLDDKEAHYCKVLCDEIFGRKNYVTDVIWNSRKSVSNDAIISLNHNYNLIYAKNIDRIRELAKKNKLFKLELQDDKFSNPDNDTRGAWVADPFDAPNIRTNLQYAITNPITSQVFYPPTGRHWRTTEEEYRKLVADNRIIFGKNGKSKPQLKRFLSDVKDKGSVPVSIWSDVDTTTNGTQHSQELFGEKAFTNPKPEKLIERIIQLSTTPNDLVLDSFLGSGTTAAVAHKMGRRYIGIEMGNHAITHCVPRLKAVVDGEQGGISKAVNWQGGGGFRFYKLGNEVFDADGCINEGISFEDLSAHIWFTETKTPFNKPAEKSTFLGIKDNVAYALLYNGILKDKRVDGGNVLTNKTLKIILDDMHNAPYDKLVIYGESSRIGQPRLKSLNIEFKQTPYDIKAR